MVGIFGSRHFLLSFSSIVEHGGHRGTILFYTMDALLGLFCQLLVCTPKEIFVGCTAIHEAGGAADHYS